MPGTSMTPCQPPSFDVKSLGFHWWKSVGPSRGDLERWNSHFPESRRLLERSTLRKTASRLFSYRKKWARGGSVFRWITLRLFQSGVDRGNTWGWPGPSGREGAGASAVEASPGGAEVLSPGFSRAIGAITECSALRSEPRSTGLCHLRFK